MKVLYSREEMLKLNIEALNKRGVSVDDIAKIAYNQQSRYIKDISYSDCVYSVEKILSIRDVFHAVQLGIEIDILAEENKFSGPIGEILKSDLGVFGIDELFGLHISALYGCVGQTNFGDIDVNKPGLVKTLNEQGKNGKCHTMLDDIVGAIAAAASTRVAQIENEEWANIDDKRHQLTIDEL